MCVVYHHTHAHLKPVRHILLVERVQAHELEALGHHVERLVVRLGAHRHLVGADLRD